MIYGLVWVVGIKFLKKEGLVESGGHAWLHNLTLFDILF